MRIPCPFCGDRDVQEFTYLGDATVARPDRATDAERDVRTTSTCATIPPGRIANTGITPPAAAPGSW